MVWISGEVDLTVRNGCRHYGVTKVREVEREGSGLPKGHEVNPGLADSNSELWRLAKNTLFDGGYVYLGTMRTMNGGGVYTLPAHLIDLTCADGDHEVMWRNVCDTLGGEPTEATPVVKRGWGAPGTFGKYDGGGAGRGERIPTSPQDFKVKHCLAENLGEIGLIVDLPGQGQGRVQYTLTSDLAEYTGWLNRHVYGEWSKSHPSVPMLIVTAEVELLPLPDSMEVEGVGLIENIKGPIEQKSASTETLVRSRLNFQDMPDGARLRFVDLESRGAGNPLKRPIGVVLRYENRLGVIDFRDGRFDYLCTMNPVTKDTVKWIGNEKFEAVVQMIK